MGGKHVYVLELKGGCVYVGKSSNVKRRLKQHMQGTYKSKGASFTKKYKPTGRILKRLGDLDAGKIATDGPERDETLRWMHRLGADKVRGWKYVRKSSLKKYEMKEIQDNLRELFDLCRKCGKKGHFATGCPLVAKKKKISRKKP